MEGTMKALLMYAPYDFRYEDVPIPQIDDDEILVQVLGWKIPWRMDRLPTPVFLGFPGGSAGKESTCNVGDLGLIPGLERFPGGGHGDLFQYYCLENPHGQRSLRSTGLQRGGNDLATGQQFWVANPINKFSAAAAAKLLQSCLTLCDPIDGSPPGSTIPGILQARTLEWIAISFSKESEK